MSIDSTELIVDLLARGHMVRFRARGPSMHPIIRENDYLLVEPAREIRRGDVVLTLAERGLTAHRVIEIAGERVITRGDNAPCDDDPVDRSKVLGRVTHAEREGRQRAIRRARALSLRLRRVIARCGVRQR
ncbi:MAG TPA: S24/S26 family peptidase [Thermoanaerobaculia bacterium]|nr:S24/S26 family peptidase [Thermoanaerobaculia bacterium]